MMGKMKAIHGIVLLAVLTAGICLASCATNTFEVKTPDFAIISDGTYRGSFKGGMVQATVDVIMAGGRIEKVKIVAHRCGLGKPAEAIVNEVVEKQSLDVDVVSGATRSSRVILKAIEVALEK